MERSSGEEREEGWREKHELRFPSFAFVPIREKTKEKHISSAATFGFLQLRRNILTLCASCLPLFRQHGEHCQARNRQIQAGPKSIRPAKRGPKKCQAKSEPKMAASAHSFVLFSLFYVLSTSLRKMQNWIPSARLFFSFRQNYALKITNHSKESVKYSGVQGGVRGEFKFK